MAATTDLVTDTRNAARPNSARVSSPRTTGATTLNCDNLSGWPTASKVHFVTYQIDSSSNPVADTQLDCSGIVSGNNIGSVSVIDGTDTGNIINDVVEMLPTAAWGQDLATALTAQHSRTGKHVGVTNTGGMTTDTLIVTSGSTLPAGDIGTADIANASITNAKLATTSGELGGAWQSYTPSVTLTGGTTNGNAVITGAYSQVGKTVHFWVNYILGSTTNFSGLSSIIVTLPVTASSAFSTVSTQVYGTGIAVISGSGFEIGALSNTSTTFQAFCYSVSASYATTVGITATNPGSWVNGSSWGVTGTYEAA